MNYEQKYKDTLEKARTIVENKDASSIWKNWLCNAFPELKKSEDEKIRKELLEHCINRSNGKQACVDASDYKRWADWLFRIGEENRPNAKSDEVIINENIKFLELPHPQFEGIEVDNALTWLEKQGKHSIYNVPSKEVILAIWDLGNEWKELTNGCVSTEHGTQLYYIQKHWHESEYYLQKKQGEQKSAEWHKGDEQNLNACLGYIPDEYLRRWLMDVIHVKYDKPTDKVEPKDYSSIDPHFGKPIDKQKPKFHEGDWVILFEHNDSIYQVERIDNYRYYLRHYSGYTISPHFDRETIRLWTIEDAKDGDVLYSPTHHLIWIYKNNKHYYASINLNYADGISFDGDIVIPSDVCPATKEQRELLFQKIEEADYKWDDNKKKLKKIKKNDYEPDTLIEESYQQQADDLIDMVTEKSTWSEEDWNYIADLISYFNGSSLQHDTPDVISWLKSFKPQNTWIPSEEQMKALEHFVRGICESGYASPYENNTKLLYSLLNDLKKLKR